MVTEKLTLAGKERSSGSLVVELVVFSAFCGCFVKGADWIEFAGATRSRDCNRTDSNWGGVE